MGTLNFTYFAENCSFLVQDKIQSFHWVNQQATFHPFVYYYKAGSTTKCRSLCIISDHVKHDTATIYVFQKFLIADMKENVPSVRKVIYFSDGSGSQYKNKKNLFNLCHHYEDFVLEAEWNFFDTSHGKDACDCVGNTTKKQAAKASLQRTQFNQLTSSRCN